MNAGASSQRETFGHSPAIRGEHRGELAQRCVLPADLGYVR
jgi:hypothetical protein